MCSMCESRKLSKHETVRSKRVLSPLHPITDERGAAQRRGTDGRRPQCGLRVCWLAPVCARFAPRLVEAGSCAVGGLCRTPGCFDPAECMAPTTRRQSSIAAHDHCLRALPRAGIPRRRDGMAWVHAGPGGLTCRQRHLVLDCPDCADDRGVEASGPSYVGSWSPWRAQLAGFCGPQQAVDRCTLASDHSGWPRRWRPGVAATWPHDCGLCWVEDLRRPAPPRSINTSTAISIETCSGRPADLCRRAG